MIKIVIFAVMQNTIQKIKKSLSKLYPENEVSNLTKLIIQEIMGEHFAYVLSDKNRKITSAEEVQISKIVNRLKKFEPIQYILGETEFFGLPFLVNPSVLIPRPETEELVELILTENNISCPYILDIGTGSGVIAIALKDKLRDAHLTGWDISQKALETAKINAKKNKVEVSFSLVDILNEFPENETFDIIVSNPPYVLDSEKANMNQNVLDYEPHTALFVPENAPLLFYEAITNAAEKLLRNNGKLYFEINQQLGSETVSMLEQKGYINIILIKDLSNNDRIVKAQKRSS